MKTLNIFLFFIMDDMVYWSMTHIQMCGCFVHCYAAIFLHDGFNCCNGLWCHYSVCLTRWRRVCYRTNAVHEPPSPLVQWQWQTCITILNFHSSINSDGFHPFAVKNGWQNAVLLWCMLKAGPPFLHYYCTVVLHSCIVLPPVAHSSNREYRCCPLARQSSCDSNFYRIFKFLIWLSFVVNWSIKWWRMQDGIVWFDWKFFFWWKKEASFRSEIVKSIDNWCVMLSIEHISGPLYSVNLGCCNWLNILFVNFQLVIIVIFE